MSREKEKSLEKKQDELEELLLAEVDRLNGLVDGGGHEDADPPAQTPVHTRYGGHDDAATLSFAIANSWSEPDE